MRKEDLNLTDYEKKILFAWEEVYKKGQLTFWLLFSLRSGKRSMYEMKKFISASTNGILEADDKSMYRALRRLKQMDLVDYSDAPSSKGGAATKAYFLTNIGDNILDNFINRNITGIFFKPEIISLMKGTK